MTKRRCFKVKNKKIAYFGRGKREKLWFLNLLDQKPGSASKSSWPSHEWTKVTGGQYGLCMFYTMPESNTKQSSIETPTTTDLFTNFWEFFSKKLSFSGISIHFSDFV